MSQAALARAVGVGPALVSRWLNEDEPVIPSSENCARIADVFGIDPLVVLTAAGHYIARQMQADPEWEVMQRELRAIYESYDRSRWGDLTATFRALSSLVSPVAHGSAAPPAHGYDDEDNHPGYGDGVGARGSSLGALRGVLAMLREPRALWGAFAPPVLAQ